MNLNKDNIEIENEENFQKSDVVDNSSVNALHPSLFVGSNYWQTTLSSPINFNGVGLHSGKEVHLSLIHI